MTKEEKLLAYLESTPWQLILHDLNNGAEPSISDLTIINDIEEKYKLPVPVINVLIQFVMIKTDKKMPKGYTEKIASHWARKGIKTAKEALDLSRKEDDRRRAIQRKTVPADRDKLNAKVRELVDMYYKGKVDYAIGGLETLSVVFGVDLLKKYGIDR